MSMEESFKMPWKLQSDDAHSQNASYSPTTKDGEGGPGMLSKGERIIRSFKNHHATEATREVAKMITSVDIVVLHELKVFEVRYRKSSHRVGVLSRPILDFHIQSFMGVISKTKNNREHAED